MEEITATVHFKRPEERPFTAAQRASTTVLFGGLTYTHEYLLCGAMEALGYRVEPLTCPDNDSLAVGKEYCNRGQCNPTYYTVGNLVKHLKGLREQGVQDIEDSYVFFTAGACGPCRFGMYESEFRKALVEAGFPGFRVITFKQSSPRQSGAEAGVHLNLQFFVAILRAIMVGDLLNEVGYKIRPYEVNPGETDQRLEQARQIVREALKSRRSAIFALRQVRKLLDTIQVDYARVKPKVKITGEFWAQTTEGDGNYRIMGWLEKEGAEVLVEPVSTWISYLIWSGEQQATERLGLKRGRRKLLVLLKVARLFFDLHYALYRAALGFKPDPLPDQRRLAAYARAYYNTHLRGGEGHLEVSKHILAMTHKKAHMVISLKPFGCMPSTMSDGVQSKVINDYRDSIFVPIETSGDGEVNVRSRVQMKLFEAKQRAREELQRVLAEHRVSLEQVQEFATRHPELRAATLRLPHKATGTAANYAALAARRMG